MQDDIGLVRVLRTVAEFSREIEKSEGACPAGYGFWNWVFVLFSREEEDTTERFLEFRNCV
jgi:hypothetical protein